jgi:hypothetical protein
MFPFYKFKLDVDREKLSQVIIDKHNGHDYVANIGNSIPISILDDKDGLFDNLYQQFFNCATQVCGPLDLDIKNNRTCWAYLTNRNFYRGGIHDHMQTCTINSVFYVHVPQTSTLREGSLSFYNNKNEEIFNYVPKTGDLIIFPNYAKHQPHQTFTDDYRLSINMEIRCNNVWNKQQETTAEPLY